MVLFSNLIWNPSLRKTVGWSMIGCLFFFLAINTLVIIYISVKNMLRSSRLKYLAKLRDKEMKERDLELSMMVFAKDLNINIYQKANPSQFEASILVF